MAVPIVNDWKAIHDRMQQIKAEQSPSRPPCPRCRDVGWIANFFASRGPYRVCDACRNPKRLPRPAV